MEVLVVDRSFVDNTLEAGGLDIDQCVLADAGIFGREGVAGRNELSLHPAGVGYIPNLDVFIYSIPQFVSNRAVQS